MNLDIYIEGERIDLFSDEVIELNSSVANSEDISKLNTDYTKTFTVPASDNNNKIFKNYYNADIDNTFDARTKKNARIELKGLPFRTGKMRLEKVSVKSGRPSAYTINFWGNLVNLKTLFKDDALDSLNLSAYNHSYSYSNVKTGLTTGLFSGNIIYTLMSQSKQYMYNSNISDNTNTDVLVNIAYNGSDRGVLWSDLKPSIKVIRIIEAIEAKYGITFSNNFFAREEFINLYLWLNNSDSQTYTERLINWNSGDAGDFGFNFSTDRWIVNSYTGFINNFLYRVQITPEAGFEGVPYKIIARNNGIVHSTVDASGSFTGEFIQAPDPPFNITFHVAAAANFQYTAALLLRANTVFGHADRTAGATTNTITDTFVITEGIPKIKVIDFMKSFFNMFKLVAIPDEYNNVYVNTIDSWYMEGEFYDLTKYVEFDSYEVERGKIFSSLAFKFQEPTTILNKQFKLNTGEAYGDETLQLADEDGEPLDGDSVEISLPFEQVVYERITDIETNTLTTIQYALITDESIKPVNPKAVLMYNNVVGVSANPISLTGGSTSPEELDQNINTPSHTIGFDSPKYSLLWGEEFSTWNGVIINNTLFSNYWYKYITGIFNIKRRNFKFKAILPERILTKLKLNDVLFIKDRYYRINDFTVNLTTNKAVLNLINTFENNFGIFAPSQNRVYLSRFAQSYKVYVSNGLVMNFTKIDSGSGILWATITQEGSNMVITVTENTGSETRDMYIEVDNGSGKSFNIYLNQSS